MVDLVRRKLIGSLVAAPAILKLGLYMPVKSTKLPSMLVTPNDLVLSFDERRYFSYIEALQDISYGGPMVIHFNGQSFEITGMSSWEIKGAETVHITI